MSPLTLQLSTTAPGSYRSGVSLPMAGRWQLVIRLPEGVARVNMQAKGGAITGRFDWNRVLPGLVLILLAAGQLFSLRRLVGLSTRVGRVLAAIGVSLAILGVFLIVRDLGSHVRTIRAPGLPTLYVIDFPGRRSLQVFLDPERPGPVQVHATYFDAEGRELPITRDIEIRAVFGDQPSVVLPVRRFGPGHFIADATLTAGSVRIELVALVPQGDTLRVTLTVQI